MVSALLAIYGTQKFINVFTAACHWTPFRARWTHYRHRHCISFWCILMWLYRLHLKFPTCLFFSDPNKCSFLIVPMRSTCPVHLFLYHVIPLMFYEYRLNVSMLVFCAITPCGLVGRQRFGETYCLLLQCTSASYSGSREIKARPWDRLSWLFSWFSSISLDKSWDSTLN
jgi:hypothetical protein